MNSKYLLSRLVHICFSYRKIIKLHRERRYKKKNGNNLLNIPSDTIKNSRSACYVKKEPCYLIVKSKNSTNKIVVLNYNSLSYLNYIYYIQVARKFLKKVHKAYLIRWLYFIRKRMRKCLIP